MAREGGAARSRKTPSAERNADVRVLLALVRIYRGVQLPHEEMSLSHVAKPLWPWLRRHSALLVAALRGGPASDGRRSRRRPVASTDTREQLTAWIDACGANRRKALAPELPPDAVLEAIGEGVVRSSISYDELLDVVQAELEAAAARSHLPTDHTVELVCTLLQLTEAEQRFLRLAAAVQASSLGTRQFAHASGPARLLRAVRCALDMPDEYAVRSVMRRSSRLLRSGLLDTATISQHTDMEDALRLSRQGMLLLSSRARTLEGMAALVLRKLPLPTNDPLAWPHLEERARLVQRLLAEALARGERGVNILLHGGPGTGKTQFAAQLVRGLGVNGFRVADMDADGDPASRADRLGSLMMTQFFAPAGRSIVVLDEAEDIFNGEYNNPFGRILGRRDDSKSWTNSLLEGNAHPVIWISNRIDHLDPAYVRRFTYCLEFPATPRGVRRAIARSHLEAVGCSPAAVDAVAADANVSPALLASAARFTTLAQLSGSAADDGVKLMLGDMLKALGHEMRSGVPERSTRFDLRYLNARGAISPAAVMSGLERLGRGRVMLSGPPGTGKTQLAAEVAQRLGRELVYKTASDINSMWFGESERNVARMFQDCDPQGEVLFLDEADTLLGSREGGAHRAVVAVTAEFLRQVEAFAGVFLCATNFRRDIDAALLRRFEYRMELLPLTAQQRQLLFCEVALGWDGSSGNRPSLAAQLAAALDKLDQLTPGDFANVVRRVHSLQLQLDAGGWVEELRSEHEAKPGTGRGAIGFT
jgi:transitional endoplasmic reticulum ATPase